MRNISETVTLFSHWVFNEDSRTSSSYSRTSNLRRGDSCNSRPAIYGTHHYDINPHANDAIPATIP